MVTNKGKKTRDFITLNDKNELKPKKSIKGRKLIVSIPLKTIKKVITTK